MKEIITVEVFIQAPPERAWMCFTEPEHIKKWNAASDEWHSSSAEHDLRAGGRFTIRMEAKDGSTGWQAISDSYRRCVETAV